ncbi:hypothetical protein [Sphaerisporangium sp. TRM90804]|uniref:hypothetical protein n=1 Tax=Sphaerisporangium sp. TRM90804 TaxID=3031113 RepID=UPI0024491A8D|nr:hypothetical protein [Sphaerisporangium sp. TRM90804]MDH2425850.1 hypothetical protein [Sphaerisporangium sp. TRM90804]
MNDSDLVEALRARDPGALAALYDGYAEGIYRYAWAVLQSSDGAQVVLRDTMIAAEAHIHALADARRVRAWLYALARGECARRRSSIPPAGREESAPDDPAVPGTHDGDMRLVAAGAVAALPGHEREALDLLTRHEIPGEELAAVLGVDADTAERLRQAAGRRLESLVTSEILARNANGDCPARGRIQAGLSWPLDPPARERLLEHSELCELCAPHRERRVSAAKVFALLPAVTAPETLRVRVMSCFIDPELVPYRRYVARRTGLLAADGFPAGDAKGRRLRPQVVAGTMAAVAVVAAAVVLVGAVHGAGGRLSGDADALTPARARSGAPAVSGHAPSGRSGGLPTLTPIVEAVPSTVPMAVLRQGAGVPGLAPVPTLLPTPPVPVPTVPRPPSASPPPVPLPSPTTEPPEVIAPTAPPSDQVGPPQPPREHPPAKPPPPVDHQNGPPPTPCPPTAKPVPPASPPQSARPTLAPMPPGGPQGEQGREGPRKDHHAGESLPGPRGGAGEGGAGEPPRRPPAEPAHDLVAEARVATAGEPRETGGGEPRGTGGGEPRGTGGGGLREVGGGEPREAGGAGPSEANGGEPREAGWDGREGSRQGPSGGAPAGSHALAPR